VLPRARRGCPSLVSPGGLLRWAAARPAVGEAEGAERGARGGLRDPRGSRVFKRSGGPVWAYGGGAGWIGW